jgi:hypothetical protein
MLKRMAKEKILTDCAERIQVYPSVNTLLQLPVVRKPTLGEHLPSAEHQSMGHGVAYKKGVLRS